MEKGDGAYLPVVGHCRHCWGDCLGTCLLPGATGLCIHKPDPKLTFRQRAAALGGRRFWHRVLHG
jgi:hypothetical protein